VISLQVVLLEGLFQFKFEMAIGRLLNGCCLAISIQTHRCETSVITSLSCEYSGETNHMDTNKWGVYTFRSVDFG
jgi:hypothetical protein